MKDIIIIGAGGFAQEVLWIIDCINADGFFKKWNVVGFVNEYKKKGDMYKGYPVFDIVEVRKIKHAAIGIGDSYTRQRFSNEDFIYPNIIHPNLVCASGAKLDGEGIVISTGNTLMPYCTLKSFVNLNVGTIIGHDAVIKEYSTISPGALIMGNCVIGKYSTIGVGVAVREKINVGDNCIIGANAAVVKDIPDNSMALGIPAKVVKTI